MEATLQEGKLGYSVAEAAKMIGCGPTKFWEEVRAGNIKSRRLGRKVIILASDLYDYINALPEREVVGG
jgi:excisionase family DNA binding protein